MTWLQPPRSSAVNPADHGVDDMTPTSGQTTGNVPVEGIDPGGTHGSPSGNAQKKGTSDLENARPEVQSGDQNDHVTRATGPRDAAGKDDDEDIPYPGAPA